MISVNSNKIRIISTLTISGASLQSSRPSWLFVLCVAMDTSDHSITSNNCSLKRTSHTSYSSWSSHPPFPEPAVYILCLIQPDQVFNTLTFCRLSLKFHTIANLRAIIIALVHANKLPRKLQYNPLKLHIPCSFFHVWMSIQQRADLSKDFSQIKVWWKQLNYIIWKTCQPKQSANFLR